MIKNSKHFSIKGKPTFNNVRGDQINNMTLNVDNLIYNGGVATKRTEYDEFEYVKRGNVIPLEEICSVDITEMKLGKDDRLHIRDRGQKRVYSVELVGRKSKFTALVYEGEEARMIWENDFQQCSRNRNPNSCLLFALNHSEVPMLIFHHDLIPLAHLYTMSFWTDLYVSWLVMQMGCSGDRIWMDTSKGVFCAGPPGPGPLLLPPCSTDNTVIVPSTRDMLNADTISSYFRQFKCKELHQTLVSVASSRYKSYRCNCFLYPATPEVWEAEELDLQSLFPGPSYEQLRSSLLGLRFDHVYSTSLEAVARWPREAMQWWWSSLSSLHGLDRTSVRVGELTRFSMCGDNICVHAHLPDYSRIMKSWLSQSPRCMEDGNNDDYFLIEAWLTLESGAPREYDDLACFFKLCDGEIPPAIYLFLYPPPMTMSELISWCEGRTHFWSLDENGQFEMTEDELEQWGVPRLAPVILTPSMQLRSWPSSIYTTLYDWQVACGFDPTTADFARHLGYPELEILRPKKKSSSWWEAAPGISAFGI